MSSSTFQEISLTHSPRPNIISRNKGKIAVAATVIALIALAVVLYKYGFFKSTQPWSNVGHAISNFMTKTAFTIHHTSFPMWTYFAAGGAVLAIGVGALVIRSRCSHRERTRISGIDKYHFPYYYDSSLMS